MKGEYLHSIDSKGRLMVPSKLREELGETFVVTKGLDGCLFVYPQKAWDVLETNIKALPMAKGRELKRFFFSSATDCTLDGQGRMLVSPILREFAELKKEVTIIGVSERIEVWNTDKWNEYNNAITLEQIESAMEDIGF